MKTAFFAALLMLGAPAAAAPPFAEAPLVIAHRGASGERPEHTLMAYERAIDQGADYIEPDLVLTRDGVLVARHENEISGTTDVASRPEFAARKTTKSFHGFTMTGWFTEDFTLAELKTLKARERLADIRTENTRFDGQQSIPTFAEILEFVARKSKEKGRRIGVYPETKHPFYFSSIGLPHEKPMLDLLKRYGYTMADDPVFIQSFEVANLQALRSQTKLRLIQLIDNHGGPMDRPGVTYADMVTPAGLAKIATYADGIGADTSVLIVADAKGGPNRVTPVIADAHKAGLAVHAWTFRAENAFLEPIYRRGADKKAHGDLETKLKDFYAAGVDGVFSDFPGVAVKARKAFLDGRTPRR